MMLKTPRLLKNPGKGSFARWTFMMRFKAPHQFATFADRRGRSRKNMNDLRYQFSKHLTLQGLFKMNKPFYDGVAGGTRIH